MPDARRPLAQPDFVWLFFRLRGRIGRQAFLLGSLLVSCAVAFPYYRYTLAPPATPTADGWMAVFGVVFLGAVWASFALGVKRLHDFGRPGVAAVSLLLPFVSIIAFVALCVVPGTPGPNAYGEETDAPA